MFCFLFENSSSSAFWTTTVLKPIFLWFWTLTDQFYLRLGKRIKHSYNVSITLKTLMCKETENNIVNMILEI